MHLQYFIFIWLAIFSTKSLAFDYCKFTQQHTMCKFKTTALGKTCGTDVPKRSMTDDEKKAVVEAHNSLRSKIATGKELKSASGALPKAANMLAMTWDDELATVAQRLTDQCIFDHDCNDCRKVERFGVGQNLHCGWSSVKGKTIDWNAVVSSWYSEVSVFNKADIDPFKWNYGAGHFTQVVWWESWAVGCGVTEYDDNGWWAQLVACNYGPGGNMGGGKMYAKGEPCSSCPSGRKCSTSPAGLCEKE